LRTLLYTYKVVYIHKRKKSEYNIRVRKVLRIKSGQVHMIESRPREDRF